MISGAALIAPLAALFLVGLVLALRTRRYRRRAVRTRARVVDHEASMGGTDSTDSTEARTSYTYYTVEFTDRAMRHHRIKLTQGTVAGADNTVPILYDPDRPRDARLDSRDGGYVLAGFCMAPAVLYALLLTVVKLMLVFGAGAS